MALAITGSKWESFAQLLTLLIIFVFVLALTYFATRWAGNYQKNKFSGSNIKILETMKISNTKYIQVVKIGSKCFAVAVCKDSVSYLCELKEDDLIYQETSTTNSSTESFKSILDKFKKDKPED